ncbi:hypothetical protein PsYK624_148190 [Phanerochaete sordida]|uniref:Uncharacterized protein n=1 Tax=Phanerochaete sordida TaxID=48140 RepID=A0A9P3GP47_9APHY|nr:hypothetical protein PsYK624_148190 [Phanerochaete sordida]
MTENSTSQPYQFHFELNLPVAFLPSPQIQLQAYCVAVLYSRTFALLWSVPYTATPPSEEAALGLATHLTNTCHQEDTGEVSERRLDELAESAALSDPSAGAVNLVDLDDIWAQAAALLGEAFAAELRVSVHFHVRSVSSLFALLFPRALL